MPAKTTRTVLLGSLFGDCGSVAARAPSQFLGHGFVQKRDGSRVYIDRGEQVVMLGSVADDISKVVGAVSDAGQGVIHSIGETKEQAISNIIVKGVIALAAGVAIVIVAAKLSK